MEIIIKPITEKGKEAIKRHLKSIKIRDKIVMRSLGIKQKLDGDKLIVSVSNIATKMLEKRDPAKLKAYLSSEQDKLTGPIDKMGISKDIDYKVEVK